LDKEFKDFVHAVIKVLTRVVYGADNAEIINDGKAVVFTIKGETKYATIQVFEYESKEFTYNKETFDGEIGVIQLSPLYIRIFNRDKVKEVLINNKQFIKRNKHGDMSIPYAFVKDIITEINSK